MGDEMDDNAQARDDAAERRDDVAETRDVQARGRDQAADARDMQARERDEATRQGRREETDRLADRRLRDNRATDEEDRVGAAADREATRAFLEQLREHQVALAEDRRATAEDRRAAAEDRRAAAKDRELAAWARQQAAVEAAQLTVDELARLARTLSGRPEAGHGEPRGEGTRTAAELDAARVAGLAAAQYAADLANEVADSEEKIATTLRELAAHADPAARDRRLALAEEAARGRETARERGDQLRALAGEASNQLVTTVLRTLLDHAAGTCAALAETEQAIAAALMSLTAHEGPVATAEHKQEAQRAIAAAEETSHRARQLDQLKQGLAAAAPAAPAPEQPAGNLPEQPAQPEQPAHPAQPAQPAPEA